MEALLDSHAVLVCAIAWLTFMLCIEGGRQLGRLRLRRSGAKALSSNGVVEAAILGLIGLLLAFTFFGAAQRFDHRRDLIVTEANMIGTAYRRIDLLPIDAQPALKDAFKRYVKSRVEAYRHVGEGTEFAGKLEVSAGIQDEIWDLAVSAGKRDDAVPAANILLLPALNEMIDITTTRRNSLLMHPPTVIFVMLLVVAQIGAILAGFVMAGAKTRSWLHQISFATIMTIAIYVVVDMEYPRRGLITIDDFAAEVVGSTRLD